MNKRLFKLLSFVFMLVLALPLAAKSAFAETASTEAATGTPKAVVATITDFRVEDRFGKTATEVNKANVYAIAMTWDASANANVEPGDYFDVTLPNEMRFTAANPASTFNITDAATGEVMAVAHVNPGTGGFGGNMHVVFTDYVNNHTDLRGTARLGFTIDSQRVQTGTGKSFIFTVSGNPVPVTFDVTAPGTIGTEYLSKWGKIVDGNANEIQWTGRINYSGGNFHNVRLHDQLLDQGITPGMLTISPDGQSFDLDLSGIDLSNGQSFKFTYRTTYVPGVALRNLIKMYSDKPEWSSDWVYRNATSGGEGTSTIIARIRIVKVDKNDHNTKLAGAVFKVTSTTDSSKTWTITTGEDGTATTEKLPAGTYSVQEITAPAGYQLNTDTYNLTVSETTGVIKTVEDEKTPTVDVQVNKTWVGTVGGPVTVRLYKDGVASTETVTLDQTNNWAATFSGLLRNDATDGHVIAYTVVEENVPAGYTSAVSGNQTDGFTVTNTEIPPNTPPTTP
ncbi:MAG: Cna B-type domain-containing protein, partial [Atopobium sp.]|nr:Cna B-type domain-containing protein [Atopobium sp.]